jgi:hypothetical protein
MGGRKKGNHEWVENVELRDTAEVGWPQRGRMLKE